MTYRYSVPRDFALGESVSCGQVFRWRQVTDGYWAGAVGDQVFAVREAGDRYIVSSNVDEAAFRSLFRLDADWPALVELLRQAGVGAADPFVRTVRSPSPTEALFSFMCTANNHIARIQPMVEALGRRGPVVWEHEGLSFHAFPDIEVLALVEEAALRGQGFGYRARHITDTARRLASLGGASYLEGLKSQSPTKAVEGLCQFPGVGRKVADCAALHGLGHTGCVPVDTHIWKFAVDRWFPQWQGVGLTPARYEAVADRFRQLFGDSAGMAQQLVFHRSLRPKRAPGG